MFGGKINRNDATTTKWMAIFFCWAVNFNWLLTYIIQETYDIAFRLFVDCFFFLPEHSGIAFRICISFMEDNNRLKAYPISLMTPVIWTSLASNFFQFFSANIFMSYVFYSVFLTLSLVRPTVDRDRLSVEQLKQTIN